MVYLIDNPPETTQFRSPRRQRPIGVIIVHTAENPADLVGQDSGAEGVARFIANRSDYGSYHDLVDSDSRIQLVRYSDEAFHCATHQFNRRTTGLSVALRTEDWDDVPEPRLTGYIENAARAAADQAAYHLSAGGVVVPARRITIAQALAGDPGFLTHADADPARRTDPGRNFPWSRFIDAYSRIRFPKPDAGELPTQITDSEMEAIVSALPILRRGDRGDGVLRVQNLMQAARHVIDTDGKFGPDMSSQVRAFRRARGLSDEALVDAAMWRWLLLGRP
jgi:hypothetical protein